MVKTSLPLLFKNVKQGVDTAPDMRTFEAYLDSLTRCTYTHVYLPYVKEGRIIGVLYRDGTERYYA